MRRMLLAGHLPPRKRRLRMTDEDESAVLHELLLLPLAAVGGTDLMIDLTQLVQ